MSLSKKIICRLFGRRKPPSRFNLTAVESVLIRPMGHLIGDTVMHIAYIRQLKTLYPDCRIGILVNGRSRPIYECCHLADELIDDTFPDCLRQHKKWQLYLDFYETFNSQHIIKGALLAPAASVIFHKASKSYYNTETLHNYTFHCPPPASAHMTSQLQTSVFADYFPIPRPDISLDREQTAQDGNHYWKSGKLRVLLAPQGSMAERKIPPQETAALLNGLTPQIAQKCQFLLCHTRGSTDYLAQLQTLSPNLDISCSPQTDLRQYLSLLAASDLVVAVDSGNVHLACAFRRPLLCFFADDASNIAKWHPLPADGVPVKIAVSGIKNSKETRSFPMNEAAAWLERTLTEIP